ncbi:MAG: chalcone isomerase family protein [Desulfobacterales bacterium]|nr:chalcone isomerase family protein [Desulfobacterales bacterium]
MLRRIFLFTLVGLFIMVSICHAKEIGGIRLPDILKAGEDQLVLNGGGVREKFLIDVYAGGLYLVKKNNNPETIIKADEPMAIRLHVISSLITSEQMEKATMEGFSKSTGGNFSNMKSKIDAFLSVFKDKIIENDVYDLIYIPTIGTEAYKNGQLVSLTKGLDFKQALFGIWLCDSPVQKSLKVKMLGK